MIIFLHVFDERFLKHALEIVENNHKRNKRAGSPDGHALSAVREKNVRVQVEIIVALFTVAPLDRQNVEQVVVGRADLRLEENVSFDGHVVVRRAVANGS